MRDLQQQMQEDIKHVRVDQPPAFPLAPRNSHMQHWTQGQLLLQCYKELTQHHGHREITRDVLMGQAN